MRRMKVTERQQFQFLPLMLLIIMLKNFNQLIKLILFVSQGEDLTFLFLLEKQIYFPFPNSPSPKKESEKLKNSHFGQIHVQFLSFTVSQFTPITVFRRTRTDIEELLKEMSFFILSFVFLSEFVIRQVQTNIC